MTRDDTHGRQVDLDVAAIRRGHGPGAWSTGGGIPAALVAEPPVASMTRIMSDLGKVAHNITGWPL